MVADLREFRPVEIVHPDLHLILGEIADRGRLHLLDLKNQRGQALVGELLDLLAKLQLHLFGDNIGYRLDWLLLFFHLNLVDNFLLFILLCCGALAGANGRRQLGCIRNRDNKSRQPVLALELLQLTPRHLFLSLSEFMDFASRHVV